MNESFHGQDDAASQGCNVQVAVRCRPMSEEEEKRGLVPVVSCDSERRQIKVQYGAGVKKTQKTYTFDKVLGRFATQEDVFKSCVATVCDEVLEGFSCTVFAYGQTGTGKTWTMEGSLTDEKHFGIIPRSVCAIFKQLEGSGADFNLRVSFLELYNEELQDLLEPATTGPGGKPGSSGKKLRLCEDVKKGVLVLGLEEVACTSPEEVMAVLKRGVTMRQTAATLCNKSSSRSHSVFTAKIMIKETTATGEDVVRNGQLNLVDLAGSECVGRSGAKNERAREAGNINQSLLTLGRVITALVEPGHAHIPYRDSKLTRLLQESLGGKAKTCIIATLSPSPGNIDETLSTLDYAFRAKSIKNKPEVNQKMTSRTLLKEYSHEIESLKLMLQASQQKNGIYLPPAQFDQMQAQLASQADRLKEAEQEVKLRSVELEESQALASETKAQLLATADQLAATEQHLNHSRAEASRLAGELERTEWDLQAARAVVEEQIKTEEALGRQARELQASLGQARADVDGLRAKIGRHCEELQSRVQSASAFQASCSASLSSLQALLLELQAHGEASARMVTDAVRQLASDEARQSGELVEVLRREMAAMAEEGGAMAERVGKDMCQKLLREMEEMMTRLVQSQSRTIMSRVNAYQGEAEAKAMEVSSAFSSASQAMASALTGLAQQADQAQQELHDLTAQLSIGAAGLVSDLQAYTKQAKAHREEEQARLQGWLAEEKGRLEQAAQAIVLSMQQQMTVLVQQSMARGGELVQAAERDATHSQDALEKYSQGFGSRLSALEASVGSCARDVLVGQRLQPMAQQARAAQAELEGQAGPQVQARLQGVRDGANDLVAAMTVASLEAGRQYNAALKSGAEVVRSIESETEAVGRALADRKAQADATAHAERQAAEARLQASADRIADLVSTSVEGGLRSDVAASVAQLEGSSGLLQDYSHDAQTLRPPTQLTPQKRAYPEPDSLASTRPHADIMAEAIEEASKRGKFTDEKEQQPPVAAMQVEEGSAPSEGPAVSGGEEEAMAVVDTDPKEAQTSSKKKGAQLAVVEGENILNDQQQPPAALPSRSSKRRAAAVATGTSSSRIPRPGGARALGEVKASDLNRE